jgi:hypothetical protein
MIANAKQFNARGSDIYEDAERVRKTASNFMTKYNPAYRDPTYAAIATPIPEELLSGENTPLSTPVTPTNKNWPTDKSRRSSLAESRLRYSESAAPKEIEDEDEDMDMEDADAVEAAEKGTDRFKGKTLDEAQDMIMDELIHYSEFVRRQTKPKS